MEIHIKLELTERHFYLAGFLILIVFLFAAALSTPYIWLSMATNLMLALGVAYMTFWTFRMAMNFYEGKSGHGFDISFSKIIRYATAICLIAFGLFLVAWFVIMALNWYAILIASDIMWLLFLVVPIMTLFLLAKNILESEESVGTDRQGREKKGKRDHRSDQPPTPDNEPETGGK